MIKAIDVAHARIQAPDLDEMEAYLVDFGLARSARTETALYMRGTDPSHHLHVTHLGDEPKFIGMAFPSNGPCGMPIAPPRLETSGDTPMLVSRVCTSGKRAHCHYWTIGVTSACGSLCF